MSSKEKINVPPAPQFSQQSSVVPQQLDKKAPGAPEPPLTQPQHQPQLENRTLVDPVGTSSRGSGSFFALSKNISSLIKKNLSSSNSSDNEPPHTASEVLKEFIVVNRASTSSKRSGQFSIESQHETSLSIHNLDEDDIPSNINVKSNQVQELDLDKTIFTKENQVAKNGCERCLQIVCRSKGILLAILSSLQLSFCAFLVHRLIKRNYDPSHCIIARFVGVTFLALLTIPYFHFKKKKPIMSLICPLSQKIQRWNFIKVLMRSVAGSTALGLHFYSLNFIDPGDASVIIFSNPVFVAFAAHIFLKEKCGIFPIFIALLTIIGVVIVSKPQFLTGGSDFDENKLIGICLALGSMLATTASMILVRLVKRVHFSVLTFAFGLVGLLTGIIIASSTGKLSLNETQEGDPKGLTVLDMIAFMSVAIFSFLGIASVTLALQFELAGPVAIGRSSEVIFSFLWQMISLIWPDAFSLSGASLVLICIMLTGFRQYLASLEDENKCKKRFWFVLK